MKKLKSLFGLIKSLFKTKSVEYSINLEYYVEQVVYSEHWNLYVAMVILSAGLLIIWQAISQLSRSW